jgi:hypothetical protein
MLRRNRNHPRYLPDDLEVAPIRFTTASFVAAPQGKRGMKD